MDWCRSEWKSRIIIIINHAIDRALLHVIAYTSGRTDDVAPKHARATRRATDRRPVSEAPSDCTPT